MNLQITRYVRLSLALALSLAAGTAVTAQTVGDPYGPRAFYISPVGTQVLSFTYDELEFDLAGDGTVLDSVGTQSRSITLSYTRFFDLAGKAASFTVSLPYADVVTQPTTVCCGPLAQLGDAGLADPLLQFNFPIVGGEAMDVASFLQTEPGAGVTLHLAARLPLGSYDEASPLNVGANRYEYRIGLPMSYTWGVPTQQTTVELAPFYYLFGDNDEPFSGSTSSQESLVQIEAYVTRDFGPAIWGGLNATYVSGGEISTDGVSNGLDLEYLSLGASAGGRLSRALSYSLSYDRRVSGVNDGRGDRLRLVVAANF